jgi:hypothetical protein
MSSPHDRGAHDLEAERDYWRTLIEVTNAVVTKRDLAELRTTIAPNVRRVVPHDHTNLYLFDEHGHLGPFVIDPSALPWPEHLATLIDPRPNHTNRGSLRLIGRWISMLITPTRQDGKRFTRTSRPPASSGYAMRRSQRLTACSV